MLHSQQQASIRRIPSTSAVKNLLTTSPRGVENATPKLDTGLCWRRKAWGKVAAPATLVLGGGDEGPRSLGVTPIMHWAYESILGVRWDIQPAGLKISRDSIQDPSNDGEQNAKAMGWNSRDMFTELSFRFHLRPLKLCLKCCD